MAKRERVPEREHRPAKRPKPDQESKPAVAEEIQFARQLQKLLAFQQDGLQQLRHGIASFKAFLESILYHKNDDDRPRQLSILREYLDSAKPVAVSDSEQPFLSQLWQAWSFANQNHNDHLASSVVAIFALLLKTLSSLLDFRDHGTLLCRTILQHQHLRLIKRCLDAPKQKDFLISPCLRLLIEVTSFDGGVLAREVYKRREQTFDVATLRRNLSLIRNNIPEEELQRRPSIRTWTVRYMLALLKYLHEGAKIDLLKSRPLCTGLFQHLRDDPADLVSEILSVVEQHILKDNELPRSAKASVLLQQNLERVTEAATRSREGHAVATKAFDWLKVVVSTPSYGIFRPSGWYPPGTDNTECTRQQDDIIDLGLDSIEFYDRDDRPDVRNTTLLAWIHTLRPHASLQERELVLTCFATTPELVTAYFAEKNVQLDPKVSNTWIGHASFLFEVVRLLIPERLGKDKEWAQLPPQTNIMIESILPRPLTQKVLTRCLNQSSELITFSAARILILAFEKLARVRSELSKGSGVSDGRSHLWQAASERLVTRFMGRCPKMKDVIAAFRKIPDDNDHALQRGAFSRLLKLYYTITPLQAMEENFEISNVLAVALERKLTHESLGEITEMRTIELEHLLQTARHTSGVRWFSKQGSLEMSPILTLLRIHRTEPRNRPVRELIYYVLSENYVLSSTSACNALIATIVDFGGLESDDTSFLTIATHLDDWILRVTRQPVKYLDDLENIASQVSSDDSAHGKPILPSFFSAVLLEQAPFVSTLEDVTMKRRLMAWINDYIELLMHTDERCPVLENIQKSIVALDGWKLTDQRENAADRLSEARLPENLPEEVNGSASSANVEPGIHFLPPPIESEDHPELSRWARKDIDTAVEDGDITQLILCICSQYPDIRIQAHTQLHKVAEKILSSNIEDKNQFYILVGELIETYEQHCLPKSEPLPYLAGTFATNALSVQTQPTHYMYPKINRYLNKGPEWRIRKLSAYWLDNTILSLPDKDDAYWKEVQWVLHWLVDGLRTATDMDILRRASVFERVKSVYGSPGATKELKEKVLELHWRATFVEGGSTTLITRTGTLSWLNMKMVDNDGIVNDGILNELRSRIIETCGKAKIEEWSGLNITEL